MDKGTLADLTKVKGLEMGIQPWIIWASDVLTHSSNIHSFLLYFYLFAVRCVCHRAHGKVREQLAEVSFLLLPCGFLGASSAHIPRLGSVHLNPLSHLTSPITDVFRSERTGSWLSTEEPLLLLWRTPSCLLTVRASRSQPLPQFQGNPPPSLVSRGSCKQGHAYTQAHAHTHTCAHTHPNKMKINLFLSGRTEQKGR